MYDLPFSEVGGATFWIESLYGSLDHWMALDGCHGWMDAGGRGCLYYKKQQLIIRHVFRNRLAAAICGWMAIDRRIN